MGGTVANVCGIRGDVLETLRRADARPEADMPERSPGRHLNGRRREPIIDRVIGEASVFFPRSGAEDVLVH